MRCKNCGWEGNSPGQLRCSKCNALLPQSEAPFPQPENAPRGTMPQQSSQQPLSGTLREGASSVQVENPLSTSASSVNGVSRASVVKCPKCGYPVANVSKCPNCGFNLSGGSQSASPSISNQQQSSNVNSKATISPWEMARRKSKCSLTIVEWESGEKGKEIDFTEAHIDLNRENLEPDNLSITSKIQATLDFKDGTWFISDKSAQQTTFIKVNDNTPLKDGDVILMGNCKFLFTQK